MSIHLSVVLRPVKHLPIARVQMPDLSGETLSLEPPCCLMQARRAFGLSLTASSQLLPLWFTHSLFPLGSHTQRTGCTCR